MQFAPVKKAVILAAGVGTRMLPASKAVPKVMLPIVDKPLLQYAVEECVAAGITDIVFVIAEGQEAVRDHFSSGGRIEAMVRAKGEAGLIAAVEGPATMARYSYVYQDQPLGPAHAVLCARAFLEGEPFALIYPDDLILGQSCVGELLEAFGKTGRSVVAVQRVPQRDIPQYGVVDPAGPGDPIPLRGMVEKPAIADAPSDLAIVGRYVLSETILNHIEHAPAGKGGEKYITEAMESQIACGEGAFAATFAGARYDTGRPTGYLVANIAAALRRPEIAGPLREQLAPLLEAGRPT